MINLHKNAMDRICITSLVLNHHIIWNADSVSQIEELVDSDPGNEKLVSSISGYKLLQLQCRLEEMIDKKIVPVMLDNSHVCTMSYKGRLLNLNLRNDQEWELGYLIDIYNMVFTTRQLNSILFVFRNWLLKYEDADTVMAYLSRNNYLSVEDVLNGLKRLAEKLNYINKITDSEYLLKILDYLVLIGFLYYNDREHVYSVTSLGYMYR